MVVGSERRRQVGVLQIQDVLYDLVDREIAAGTGVAADDVWRALGEIVRDLGPLNRSLLGKRDTLQARIDAWHQARRPVGSDRVSDVPAPPAAIAAAEYREFLQQIGYQVAEGGPFQIETGAVDPEISIIAGPQLVVPVDNARYALNAANARWGSLYDALYGTDVVAEDGGAERGVAYNPVRGARVIEWAERFLDAAAPLAVGSYRDVTGWMLERDNGGDHYVAARVGAGERTVLADPAQFVGFRETEGVLSSVLLLHHDLHVEIRIDADHPMGAAHPAGVKDVVLESAVTTIQDFEDSVAAVDAEDKVRVYRNWLNLMNGTLSATFMKAGRQLTRTLNADRTFQCPGGGTFDLPGRSLLLVRNVGLHMYTDAVTTLDGEPIPEGFLDAMITALAALHDLRGATARRNSRAGNVYIVKPKLHGPEEVAATVELFHRVEVALGMPTRTIKLGIMDEERRTTVNLKECIRAARQRVVFINTGFLDRTGDEIHTSMEAGPVIPKAEIKASPWMLAYEDWNVDIGIECGFPGRAQIGKGMWAMPDEMKAMVDSKIEHPRAAASTAWVPSPTAATLHATHYHQIHVAAAQEALASRPRADLAAILTPPLLHGRTLGAAEIQAELENNAQGILGYVVRWVGQGVGCSKVPDIREVELMEDRATLRISSQHIANWLRHGIIDRDDVISVFEKMAIVVDRQNAADVGYRPMAPDFQESLEFRAALELVFTGTSEASGYTETVLHSHRRERKARSV